MTKKAQDKPKLEIVPSVTEIQLEDTSRTSTPSSTGTSTAASEFPKTESPVAPVKNFQKVTNTITKQAIPQRLFRTGKTKEIYDVLYGLTRGSAHPNRSITISKPKLRKLTGVGSRITLDTCLGYLEIVGLIRVTKNNSGQHDGNEYEVLTPEEIGATTPTSTGTSRGGSPGQILGVVAGVDTTRSSTGSESMNIGLSSNPKTSFKDNNTNDDERAVAFSDVIEKLDAISYKLTGKGISKYETEKWNDFADLIVLELEIAAKRTNGISSVPAFLTEVLRRQLFASRQKQSSTKSSKPKTDTVSKSESGTYRIKPLDGKEREEAVNQLREFAEEDFLLDFKKWYTTEDWEWIIEKLGASDKK
jgi:hypothetical protein